jgi:hypothetical protein
MAKSPAKYFTAKARAKLIREAFDAFATVGFLKWKREEIERHGTAPEVVEADRASYVKDLERVAWAEFHDMAAEAADIRLLDMRQDWIERAESLARLDREGKLTMRHVYAELWRYTGGTYPPPEPSPAPRKNRDLDMER